MPQFSDTFPGSAIDSAKWAVSGTGLVTVSGGQCVVDGPTGADQIETVPTFSVDAAGTDGVVIDVASFSTLAGGATLILGPKTGTFQGFAFSFLSSTLVNAGYWNGGYSAQVGNMTITLPALLRFAKIAGDMVLDVSVNAGATWTTLFSHAISGSSGDFLTTAARLIAISGLSAAGTMTLNAVTIGGTSAIKRPPLLLASGFYN